MFYSLKKEVLEILHNAEYGTLALSNDKGMPYALPINFVSIDDAIYFHGSKKGKKIDFINSNHRASFSVVNSFALIPSFFSSTKEMACTANHFFKSVIIDGHIKFVSDYNEKVLAINLLMQKLQPEGNYHPLENDTYTKVISAVEIIKLVVEQADVKIKLGQNLSQERFEMTVNNLLKRKFPKDKEIVIQMKRYRKK